jgi:hypothetical protein
MASTNKIMIGIDDQVIELTGDAKAEFLADREATNVAIQLVETARLEKENARASAINKLATIAGLTEEEINSII